MYYYNRCIRMLRKDLDCVRRIGRNAEKLWDCITHEHTHNIYDCERVSMNTRAYLTCRYL